MDIGKKFTEIAAKRGLSVGFDDTRRATLADTQKAEVRQAVESSVDATYRGAPMAMAHCEMPSGVARVSIGILRGQISDFELVSNKLENAISDVANGTAKMPCIKYEDCDASIIIEQGRHRIAAMHDLGHRDALVNYPAGQEAKLRALLGSEFTPL